MSIDMIVTIALAAVLVLSFTVRMFIKRTKAPSEGAFGENGLAEEDRAGTLRREFGLPADAKGLDSDYAATRAIFDAVLSESKGRPADRKK